MQADPQQKPETPEDRAVTITLGADGRVLFHDLPRELLPIAKMLCPRDNTLRKREAASRLLKKGRP